MASEEAKVIASENNVEILTAFNRIPYALINAEVSGSAKDTLDELTQICKYYKVYKKGASFTLEGSNGDYVPANLKYKMSASLINKEARFLFAAPPDITVEPKGDVGKITQDAKDALTVMNDLVKTILDANKFEDALIKAAKDCFVGKRVAGLVNFNEEDGVTITFLPSTQFIYETRIGNPNIITKFVCFIVVKNSITLSEKRIFKKKFVLDDGKVYLEEVLYDGAGRVIEEVTEYQETLMPMIPAVVFINDGLTGEDEGESEIELLQGYEEYYSKLSDFGSYPPIKLENIAKLGVETVRDLFDVREADIRAQNPVFLDEGLEANAIGLKILNEIEAENACFRITDLDISGKDLAASGIPPSPEMGKLLEALLDEVMGDKLENKKEILLKRAEEIYKTRKGS